MIKSVCFAGENGSRTLGDTDSLLDVLQQFSPFCRFENGAHHKNGLKGVVAQGFLKLLLSLKGVLASHFSPSQNLIVMKKVFDANITIFALSYPSFTSLFLQLILLEQCAFTYFYHCVLHSRTTRICTKIQCSKLFSCQHQDKRMQKCRRTVLCFDFN